MLSATGYLHGGAIEQSVRYALNMADAIGPDPSPSAIAAYVRGTLAQGQVVPGYGHALLRQVDPRLGPVVNFMLNSSLLREGNSEGRGRELLTLILRASTVVPEVLKQEAPKIKNPEPNIDSLSGSVAHAFGVELDFIILVPFCSRAMGCMVQYVWDKGEWIADFPRSDFNGHYLTWRLCSSRNTFGKASERYHGPDYCKALNFSETLFAY